MANQQTLEILLKLRSDSDKGLKEFRERMKEIEEQTKKTASAFGGLSGASFKFNQITQALGTVVDVAQAVGREFFELAQRGAQVSTVEGAFQKLAASVNATGDAMLGKARAGTKGLVADYDLMLAANRGILLGLPITANEMGVLGAAATSLGKSLGVDATQALNDLITGLGRGSAAILDSLAITVNAEEELKKYAEAHGKTVEQLTAAEKKLAVYNAAITAAKETMAKLGDAQLTTADRIKQVEVGVKNFTDALGLAIARSPVLNAGLGAIADAMQKAFGANQTTLVNTLIGWVNEFAIIVAKGVSVVVSGASMMYQAWNYALIGAKLLGSGVATIIAQMTDGLRALVTNMAALPGPLGAPFQVAKLKLDETSAALKKFATDAKQSAEIQIQSFAKGNVAFDTLKKGVDGVIAKMEGARGKIIAVGDAAEKVPEKINKAGAAIAMDAEKRAEALRLIHKAAAEQREKWLEEEAKKAGEVAKRIVAIEEEKQREIVSAHQNAAVSRVQMEEAVADAMKKRAEESAEAWKRFGSFADDLFDLFSAAGLDAFASVAGAAAQTADMLAKSAQQGYISWADLGKQIVTTFKNGSAAGGAMSGAMTGFAIGGPIGAGIGAIAGGILGWMGGAKKAAEEMRKLRGEFVGAMGGMDSLKKKAAEAGVSLDNMFKAKSAAQLQRAIDQIKAKLQTWNDAHEKLNAAVEKYGFTLEELGPKFQAQQLDTMAQELLSDWTLLVASGIDVANVATRMSDSLNEMAAKARATGQSLPESLRPIYEELLRQGKLVDENGNAYGSLEEAGLHFTQSLTEGMQTLIEELRAFVAAITGVRPTIRVGVVYDDPGAPGGGGGNRPPRDEELGFASGGVGNFGAGTSATLHGREGILPLDDKRAMSMIANAIVAAGAMNGGSHQAQNIRISVVQNNREVGQTNAFLSRTRQQRTSPNANRRF